MAAGFHPQRGLSMPSSRACAWLLVAVALLVPSLAVGGAKAPEPEPAAPVTPEDREIPPDRGHIYMLEKEFNTCVRHLRDSRTPLDKRIEAVGAFALTKDARVVPLFVQIVRADQAQPIALRVAVLWALGEIGDPRGLPALQHALGQMFHNSEHWKYDEGIYFQIDGKPTNVSLQEMVTSQLGRLGEPLVGQRGDKKGFYELLMAPLIGGVTEADDPKADTRRAALITLAAVGDRDRRAVDALCAVLRAEDKYYPWDFKIIAARGLSDLVRNRRRAFKTLDAKDKLLDDIAKAFIEGAVVTDVPEVRQIVGQALREMGWADRAGRELAIVLESPALPLKPRFRTIEALTFIRSKQAADALILQLAHRDRNVRWRAAIALGATGHERPEIAVSFLGKLTTKPPEDDHFVRLKACAALGHLEDPRAIPRLAVAMDDEDWRVRSQAAVALGRIGKDAAIPCLVRRGLVDPSATVRGMSMVALGSLKREEGLEHVARLLADPKARDKEASVRLVAVRVLDQFLNPWATAALVTALGDEDDTVREAAEKAMGARLALKPKTVLPLLIDIAAKGAGPTRASALQCILGDYRSPRTLNNPKRKAYYHALLDDPAAGLRAALLAALADKDGKARWLAADFLCDLAWRGEKKDKDVLAQLAALTRDPDAKVRTIARRAANYLRNLP